MINSIEAIRNIITTEPLYVEEYLQLHSKDTLQSASPSAHGGMGRKEEGKNNGVATSLRSFPDVVKVRTHVRNFQTFFSKKNCNFIAL